jgi:hypothetical protein
VSLKAFISIALLVVCLSSAALSSAENLVAQTNEPKSGVASEPDATQEAAIEAGRKAAERARTKGDGELHSVPPIEALEDPLDYKYRQEFTAYKIRVINEHERVYHWQYISGIVIFFVVMLLVLCGVWFSWMQFQLAHHTPAAAATAATTIVATTSGAASEGGASAVAAETQKDSVTEFSASPQGIKVASSTIGVVILVISMCFFYLYLHFVYPISVDKAEQIPEPGQHISATASEKTK